MRSAPIRNDCLSRSASRLRGVGATACLFALNGVLDAVLDGVEGGRHDELCSRLNLGGASVGGKRLFFLVVA